RFLANVSSYTETPAVACVVSGFLAGLLALLVSLRDLIEMMSIGTLLAYTLVSVCVLLLRYQPESDIHGFVNFLSEQEVARKRESEEKDEYEEGDEYNNDDSGGCISTNTCGAKNLPSLGDNEMLIGKSDKIKSSYAANHPNYGTVDKSTGIESDDMENVYVQKLKRLMGPRYYTLRIRLGLPGKMDRPTESTGRTVTRCVLLLFVLVFAFCSLITFGAGFIAEGHWWAVTLLVLLVISISLLVFIIVQQPENPKRLPYMAPCVPFVPVSAMLVNIYLMLKLSGITWIRFAVWCFIGVLIYFGYGMWNSTLEITALEEEAHASTYQRYDMGVDDNVAVDDDLCPPRDRKPQSRTENQERTSSDVSDPKKPSSSRSKVKNKNMKPSFEALVVDDELDEPLE
ncbi:putative cationic amino acid transporter, partial [Silurus asotus]